MFRCIARNETASLQELGERLLSTHQDHAAGLLCLDHVFSRAPKIQQATPPEAAFILRGFLFYCQELQRATSQPNPGQAVDLQCLFGFRPVEGNQSNYILTGGTFLHKYHHRRLGVTAPLDENQEVIVTSWDLATLLQTALNDRLKRRVNEEDLFCGKARAIFPCPTLVILGTCNSNDCSRAHWENVEINVAEYQLRIQLLFQQIMIYQTVCHLESRSAVFGRRRYVVMDYALYDCSYKLQILAFNTVPHTISCSSQTRGCHYASLRHYT
jgi:hypothetical protein